MGKGMLALASVAVVALAAAGSAATAPSRPHVQHAGLVLLRGDRVLEQNFALAPGVPVRMAVTNYTTEFHTFTVPALHISKLIFPAHGTTPRTTTFTFTPRGYGAFAWTCLICPSGAHGYPHAMGGTMYAIIDPSVLP
ncbi:MAG TPA: hypothetical protein VJ986_12955 [Gaiellaceae bacterium]|nr:hypothetical protein [Gaiellaceae bacterium]